MTASRNLLRALPLRTAVSTSAGLASAAINFLACVEVAELAGGSSAWLALLVAGGLIVFSASDFAELCGLYPSAAAIRVWSRRGASDRLSLVVSFVYAATVVFVVAADGFVLAQVFGNVWPGWPGLAGVGVILAGVTAANLAGIRVAGRIQDLNAFFLLLTLMVVSLAAIGRFAVSGHTLHWAALGHIGPGWLQAVAVGVFIFVGFEWVTPLAEEFAEVRAIPRGMYIALGWIAVAFGLFTWAFSLYFPHPGGLAASVVPQLLLGRRALGAWGYWWMVIITLTTAMTTFNGGLVAASRFIYALARERVLPPALAHLNRRLVPGRALWGLAAAAFMLAWAVERTGRYQVLVNSGAGVEAFMYALAAVLVVSLRRREPARPRPFRAFWVPVRSWLWAAVFAALGIASLLAPAGGRVPWAAVFVAALTAAAAGYVQWGVPRVRQRRRAGALGRESG